ncbi:DUF4097 family beta strand repeat-containing protein [Clostridium isatidis]|uniref:DUF4097 domain-containing protein n=1 Tax=Clostridium isatidis TaxID=182773 RepID=A0A343JER5_9CLOT|nr:DUF4097 family beta strand repeat-containing protein [Clostridium isatidis]ASW44023.1 hypothetical protein BEN51_11155 [Clostridium isatidis]NLZ35323.1 DUF4097 domain-containing protein [Clostridiales bacterium]
MKKISKIILSIFVTTILLSGCGVKFGIESRRNNKINDFINRNSTNKDGEKVNIKESIEGISNLDIEIDVSNLNIMYYDGEEVEISGVLGEESEGIKVDKNFNELEIEEKYNNSNNLNSDTSSDLTIKIPSSYNGNLKLSLGVGSCKVKDLILESMEVNAGVGELYIEDVSFNELNLESGLGDININTNKKTGDMNIKGGVGNINITLGDINGNLKFEGGLGDATIVIPEDAPVNIKTSSGLGSVNASAKTSGENKYLFDINMGIGELNIKN